MKHPTKRGRVNSGMKGAMVFSAPMKSTHILVTAGPTVEYIDPVRVLTNRSTGLMGYKIAEEAVKRGHKVTLISGPTFLKPPAGVRFVSAQNACEMMLAVLKAFRMADCLIMSAAVTDFRVKRVFRAKIKKKHSFSLHFVENPDILKSLPKRPDKVVVGFALETENLLGNATKKLAEKGLDLIIANKIDRHNEPFGSGRKNIVFLEKNKKPIYINNKTKKQMASAILKFAEHIMASKKVF